jgi:hypothetical protein
MRRDVQEEVTRRKYWVHHYFARNGELDSCVAGREQDKEKDGFT